MLKSLKISNYAIIKELDLNFKGTYTVLTGETGSGKSIILGALNLVLGQRADTSVIKDKSKKCFVEAVFDIKKYNLKDFFTKNDIEYFDEAIIRREILPSGRSRAFINDTPVNLNLLKELSENLIDIHSQHDTILLNNPQFQINALDSFAKNFELLSQYSDLFKTYKKISSDLTALKDLAKKEKAEADYFEYQFNQLEEANLKAGEQEELENEQRQLSHLEEIKNALSFIHYALNGEENAVVDILKSAKNQADNISEFYAKAQEISERLDQCIIELQDLANEVEIENADLELDPERLEFVNKRLDLIYSLEHKFDVMSVEELLKLKDEFAEKLSKINSYDEQITELENKKAELEKKLFELAEKLHKKRIENKEKFENEIISLLKKLGIPYAVFNVEIEKLDKLTENGFDRVRFLFSANKDMPAQPLSKVASGGELSRVMLALKYVISRSRTLPTIIFDEIDTGISGRIADQMGELIKEMSDKIQIIQITHSPQIAAKGTQHFTVYKVNENNETLTVVKELTDNQRVNEIAKMISGENISESAINTAKELLNYS